jgi:hypothetical protein
VRAPTRLGEVALFREPDGSLQVRIRQARAARRGGRRGIRHRSQPMFREGLAAEFHCHACRATLTLARDRLQAAFAGECKSVLVGADGESVLMYF